MDKKEYRAVLRECGLTQGEMAQLLGVTIRQSNGYANGGVIPPRIAALVRMIRDRKVSRFVLLSYQQEALRMVV